MTRFQPILGEGTVLHLTALRALLREYAGPVHRIGFDQSGVLCFCRVRGKHLRTVTRRQSACHFLSDYQVEFADVRSACDELCSVLGYARRGANCQGSFQTEGAVVPRHCDDSDVLVLQLFGKRGWRLEPNSDPPKGLHALVRLPQKLRAGWSAKFPREAPIVTLKPGSALYVPRGWWHETRSDGDSFALTFSIFPPRQSGKRR